MKEIAEVFREYPFTFGIAIGLAGAAAWLGLSLWWMIGSFVVGLFVGAYIDQSSKDKVGLGGGAQ